MTAELLVALIGAVAALLQAFLIIVSIVYLNRQFGIVRACSYIERFNAHECIRRRGAVDRWLNTTDDPTVRINAFESNLELQADILGFVNLFQELGVAYLRHSVHKRTVEETFDFLIPYYWGRTRFLIEHLRVKRKSPRMYAKFEYLADRLARVESGLGESWARR